MTVKNYRPLFIKLGWLVVQMNKKIGIPKDTALIVNAKKIG